LVNRVDFEHRRSSTSVADFLVENWLKRGHGAGTTMRWPAESPDPVIWTRPSASSKSLTTPERGDGRRP